MHGQQNIKICTYMSQERHCKNNAILRRVRIDITAVEKQLSI